MQGTVNLVLLTLRDIASDGFGVPFDGLGGDIQARQQMHLFAPLLETGLAAHGGNHAPHPWRVFGSLHIQGPVQRALAAMTMRANIISPFDRHGPHYAPQLLGTCIVIAGHLSAGAGRLGSRAHRHTQQPAQSGCPGMVHRIADQHFYRLQLDAARPAPFAQRHSQKFGYLLADLLLNRFGRFFSCGDKVSSTGRARQSSSLVATKARLNSLYF